MTACDLTPSTGASIVSRNIVTWRPVRDGRQHHTPGTLPKAFHEELVHIISRGRQNMCIRLCDVAKISREFVGEWNFVLLCYGRDENRTGYHPALVQLLRGIFLQST